MTFYELPDVLGRDIDEYAKLVESRLTGNLSAAKLKAFRVPMGIYEQRDEERYMMRVRLSGGAVTPTQFVGMAEFAERYSSRPLHFTTRQDAQIHNLDLADTVSLMRDLRSIGLSSRGGGGNTVRNIAGSYDAGLDPDEAFDVMPYVSALTTRLIAEPDSWTLPRKYKIAFSGSARDTSAATVADLGFIAKTGPHGGRGFSVYVAGGMGRKSCVGTLLYEFIDHNEVYNIAEAVKRFFDKHGNRKRKHAARLRFLYEKMGHADFIAGLENELAAVRALKRPPLELREMALAHKGFIELPLFLGDMSTDKAKLLGAVMKLYGDNCIRITPNQNIFLRDIPEDKVDELRADLECKGVYEPMSGFLGQATACAGANTCKLGICLSRDLLVALRDTLKDVPFAWQAASDIILKVSGCPNTCGRHVTADIGLFGGVKTSGNRLLPAYTLVAGAVIREGETRLAAKIGVLPARKVPGFLREFFEYTVKTRGTDESFPEYLERAGRAKMEQLLEIHSAIPAFKEAPEFYTDWGADAPFSALKRLEGECSAGLFDLIELDLDYAEKQLKIACGMSEPSEKQDALRSSVQSAAHALLITKGLESSDAEHTVSLFKNHFIGSHLPAEFGELLDACFGSAEIADEDVRGFYLAVRALYDSMDDSLRFSNVEASVDTANETSDEGAVAHMTRDFRGVACPMNFVKTKLALESMETGNVLEVLLDDGAPIENVPASVKAEGHVVLKQKKLGDHWSVLIRREEI